MREWRPRSDRIAAGVGCGNLDAIVDRAGAAHGFGEFILQRHVATEVPIEQLSDSICGVRRGIQKPGVVRGRADGLEGVLIGVAN